MEIVLIGTEIHVLREILEGFIVNLEKEIKATEDPRTLVELEERKDVLKSIMAKLPVEFTFAA